MLKRIITFFIALSFLYSHNLVLADGNDSYTKLLLHCNGTDGSTSFPDASASNHTVTANGNAQVDTAQSKFGGASALFDGNGDYLSIPDNDDWHFMNGDFTFDCWARFANVTVERGLIGQNQDSNAYWDIYVTTDNKLLLEYRIGGAYRARFNMTNSYSFSINTWYHLAVVRSGSTCYMFVDGVSQAVTQQYAFDDANITNLTASFVVGTSGYVGFEFYYNGHLDEIRLSKGIARWTSNFTPPTEEYSASGGISQKRYW